MCGIAGLYRPGGFSDGAAIEAALRKAADALSHRGPDAAGVVVRAEDGVGFAHRRLSILDLDPRSDQPMLSADGKLLVTYNGEIYNFRELREELRGRGASFRTESDTEVLLEGYRIWGLDELLERAAGMFAFALCDLARGCLYLARDRAGKKPLFYAETPDGLAFASELGSLLSLSPGLREVDPAGLDAYLSLKFTPSPATLFKGARKLPPAHLLRASGDGPSQTRRYWHPYLHGRAFSGETKAWLDCLENSLSTAVQRRLVSDVPVCLFLSGGIDSSLIAAALSRCGEARMKAYSIGYGDLSGYDEFEYSRLIAKRFPLLYEEISLDSKEARILLEDDRLVLDEPISDWVWVPLYHLSRRAHADGFKVVLVGEGSDEIFFGYDSMLDGLEELERFQKRPWRLFAKASAAALAPLYRRATKGHRRFDLLRRVAAGEPVYMGSSIGFGRSQRHQVAGPRLMEAGVPEAGGRFVADLYRDYAAISPEPGDLVNLVCFIEFFSKMTEVLLQRVDRIAMLHSLEARAPFLDQHLVELAFSLPGKLKIRGRRLKSLLKELARRRLPEAIVERKKMGFSFPFKEWLRADLARPVESAFRDSSLFSDGWVNGDFAGNLLREHRSGLFDHAPRIWALYSLARWYDRWIKAKR